MKAFDTYNIRDEWGKDLNEEIAYRIDFCTNQIFDSDTGFLFDSKADRLVFVDRNGDSISHCLITAVLDDYFMGEKHSQGIALQDKNKSRTTQERLAKYGTKVATWHIERTFHHITALVRLISKSTTNKRPMMLYATTSQAFKNPEATWILTDTASTTNFLGQHKTITEPHLRLIAEDKSKEKPQEIESTATRIIKNCN